MTGRWRRARIVASAGVLVAGVWTVSVSRSTDQSSLGSTDSGMPTVPVDHTGDRP